MTDLKMRIFMIMELMTYQLMKELLPAEWFPISKTVIFFRGANKSMFNSEANFTKPKKRKIKF